MAITQSHSGTATVGTAEISLTAGTTVLGSVADTGIFQAFIDLSAMASGDAFLITVREKARAADTQRIVFAVTVSGAQAEPLWASPALALMHGWEMSIKKSAGTDRIIPWSIRKVA